MTFQNQLLEGKTALVTGGLSGIGAAIANTLAQLGAHTVAAGLPLPEGTPDTLNREIARVTLDVRSGNAVTAAVNAFDRLDIVVNCAGVISRVEEHRLDVFERVMDINLNGTMRVCAAARDSLKASAGCIVNTASMLSFFGGGLVPAYSASKGAVAQLTKSLAIAYAADGRHSRQCGCAGLDRNAAHTGVAGRRWPLAGDSGTNAAASLGHAGRSRAGRGVPVLAGGVVHDGRNRAGRRRISRRVIESAREAAPPSFDAIDKGIIAYPCSALPLCDVEFRFQTPFPRWRHRP
ncbi:NAD(P)-dependent dehydrogenase (short-subunit alcohol dehydrogenase family) [Paraburkholderia sp. 40]